MLEVKMLDGSTTTKNALSPFAVTVTVLALRGQALPRDGAGNLIGQTAFGLLDGALLACACHSAGCAEHRHPSWRSAVQKQLSQNTPKMASSLLLKDEPHLLPTQLSEPSRFMVNVSGPSAGRNVQVQDMGVPYEDFVLYSVALRLECLRLAAGAGRIPASNLLPRAVGCLQRPSICAASALVRHPSEHAIAIALPSADINSFLARLCTQTAALLLPSSVTMILDAAVTETIHASKFFDGSKSPLDIASVEFMFNSVVVADPANWPHTFPCVVSDHLKLTDKKSTIGPLIRQCVVAELLASATAGVPCNPGALIAWALSAHGVDLTESMKSMVESVEKTVTLVERAARTRQATLFKPTNRTNPLADVIVAVPCAIDNSVLMIWLEVRDQMNAGFSSKLDKATSAELLLAPVVAALTRQGITLVGTFYVPVARAPFLLQL